MSGRIPSRGSDQFNLRLPDGMRDRVADAAKDSGRSMNAEIVQRLEWSFNTMMIGKGGVGIAPITDEDFRFMMQSVMNQMSEHNEKLHERIAELSAQVEERQSTGRSRSPKKSA